ncbi:unnamed protein product [Anisakis simplex]|uniref:Transposase n=1 Tax=Anisakis simplex TaxID=6269 RepID=A0A0M3JZ01_ANISI|nr:unnamed protein product [Anisakis simplex]
MLLSSKIAVSGNTNTQTQSGAYQQHGRKISPIGGPHPGEHLIMRQKFDSAERPTENGGAKVIYRLASFDSASDLGSLIHLGLFPAIMATKKKFRLGNHK